MRRDARFQEGPAEARIRLGRQPQSADAARRFVGAQLSGWGVRVDQEIVRLLVSEIVTNAVLYGEGPSVVVDLHAAKGRLRVEVGDDNPALPMKRRSGPGATSGRGLELVDVLALAWGVDPIEDSGKVVWFEVVAGDPDTVEVHFLDIPVHLFVRHGTQMDDTLHELRLRRLDASDKMVGVAEMAEAAAELGDHFGPFHHGSIAAAELARRRGQESVDLELPLTHEGGEKVIRLLTLLDEADDLCRSGKLLALAAQPDVVRLRKWTASEIIRQMAGGAPTPFPG